MKQWCNTTRHIHLFIPIAGDRDLVEIVATSNEIANQLTTLSVSAAADCSPIWSQYRLGQNLCYWYPHIYMTMEGQLNILAF